MIIFSTSLCVVFWSFEVFSLDAYFLGWSNWWDPWLLRTPEKYILDSHMNLRAFLLWCVLATYILCSCFLFMFIVPLGFVCLDIFMKDHMVIVRGSNLLVLKFGFSVYHFAPCFFAILVLALQFGFHQALKEGSFEIFAGISCDLFQCGTSNVAWVLRLSIQLFPSFCASCRWVFLN